MRFKEAMIVWNVGGDIDVVAYPPRTEADHLPHLRMSRGACFSATDALTPDEVVSQVFIDFNTIVVRDRVDVLKAHAAFKKIDEYRAAIAGDMP